MCTQGDSIVTYDIVASLVKEPEVLTDLRARRAADFGGLFREGVAVVGVLVVPFGRIVVLVGVAHHGRRGSRRRPRTDHGEIGRGRGSRHEGSVRVAVVAK